MLQSNQILLGYLGKDKKEWDAQLTKKRQIYEQFVGELVISEQNNNQSDDHVTVSLFSLFRSLTLFNHTDLNHSHAQSSDSP
jgi:hypothetical protein